MYPAAHYDLAQAQVAELRRQAERACLARAAAQARRSHMPRRSDRVQALPAVLARRVLTAQGASS
jgi:hypothetical protein